MAKWYEVPETINYGAPGLCEQHNSARVQGSGKSSPATVIVVILALVGFIALCSLVQ